MLLSQYHHDLVLQIDSARPMLILTVAGGCNRSNLNPGKVILACCQALTAESDGVSLKPGKVILACCQALTAESDGVNLKPGNLILACCQALTA